MPIKWTPEVDQILLLKILETSQVSVDVKTIAASWPSSQEAPTPRAISERLVKIRAMAKENGSDVPFSISSGKTSAPSTPRAKTAKAKAPPKNGVVKKTAQKKGKRGGKTEANSNNSDGSGSDGVKEEVVEDNHGINEEIMEDTHTVEEV